MEGERRRGLLGPILLISAGILFLLNNLGVIGWDVWRSLINLWPILLIAIGLELLIGRRSAIGSIIIALITVGLLVGGVWLFSNRMTPGGALKDYTINQPLKGATSAEVTIQASTGSLQLQPLPETGLLIDGTVSVPSYQSLDESYEGSQGNVTYLLAANGPDFTIWPGTQNVRLVFAPDAGHTHRAESDHRRW